LRVCVWPWSLLFTLPLCVGCQVEVWLGDLPGATQVGAEQDTNAEEGRPCLAAIPGALDFGAVRLGQQSALELSLRNTCAAPVTLSSMLLSGSSAFVVTTEGGDLVSSAVTATEGVTFPDAVVVGGGQEVVYPVSFSPVDGEGAFANLVWVSDDPFGGYGLAVQLKANTSVPCIVTFPKLLDFGGALVGDESERPLLIKSCGSAPLKLKGLTFTGAHAARFGLSSDGAVLAGELSAGDIRTLTLTYSPITISETHEGGLPLREGASLVLLSDAFKGDWVVPVSGFGASEPCPHAIIAPGLPSQAPPGSPLVFDGSLSYGVAAPVASWEWAVDGPTGAVVSVEAEGGPARVRLNSNALGAHTVTLSVTDEKGLVACVPAAHMVELVEVAGLSVELWWEGGNDLDLHFLHELAVGLDLDGDEQFDGWFDKPFDTFWGNPNPNWGLVTPQDVPDDPRLAFDDYDGWGPERIVLEAPEAEHSYRVGVHHWDDRDNGPTSAWVRVWRDGVLLHEASLEVLPEDALWEVGAVAAGGPWSTPGGAPRVLLGVHRPVELKGQ
jgi:hypothetical protein